MEDAAMRTPESREESMHPVVHRLTPGHFNEGPEYSTWRTNGTTDYLLIHTISGSGRLGEISVGAGDAVLLRPGVRHDYSTAESATRWEFVFAHFHPRADWMPLLEWPAATGGVCVLHTDGELHHRVTAALRSCVRASTGGLPRAELFAVNSLEEALLWLDTQNPLTSLMDERVLRVIEHIGAHIAERLGVVRLAEVAHISPSRLTHLFSEHLGVSPQRYVERERMLLAEQLLDLTNRPIAEIAREVGWDDPLYFSQRFHHFAGVSPSRHRRDGRLAAPIGTVEGASNLYETLH